MIIKTFTKETLSFATSVNGHSSSVPKVCVPFSMAGMDALDGQDHYPTKHIDVPHQWINMMIEISYSNWEKGFISYVRNTVN